MILLKETATAEFYSNSSGDWIEFNGKTMGLTRFLKLAKSGDKNACAVLDAVKAKMKDLHYHNDMLTFIRTHFGKQDDTFDIVVKDGVERRKPNGGVMHYRPDVQYDNKEIENPIMPRVYPNAIDPEEKDWLP